MLEFFTLKPDAFGLDISDSSLKIAKLEKKGIFLSLASFGKTEVKPGIIQEGEVKDEKALSEIIKESLDKVSGKKLHTNYVVASLPEEKAFLQVIQMPKMSEEELKKAVYFEAENYIPLPVDQVYLDFQIVTPIYDHLDHFDVLIVALQKKIVDGYVNSFKKAGLKIKALEIESSAIARALIKKGISPHPLLLIDLGENRTNFIIFSGYSLRFASVLPISSRQLTQAVAEALKVDFLEAEELKLKYGLSEKYQKKIKEKNKEETSPEKIFKALESILSDLTTQINKYLRYYQSHVFHEHLPPGEKIVEKILLCGGGTNLQGMSQFLSLELRIKTEISNPWTNILKEPLTEVPGLSFRESLAYTTALGLALRGIDYD